MMSGVVPNSGQDQQANYMQGGYQQNLSASNVTSKGHNPSLGSVPQSQAGLEKDPGKEGQPGHGGWAAAMEAYYKAGTPGHGHPGSYYAGHMAPPHHPYMWGAQQIMPPYGTPPHSHYGYGSMYAPQHPAMAPTHPHANSSYGYNTGQGQGGKEGVVSPSPQQGMSVAVNASPPPPAPNMASGGSGQVPDPSTTEGSSGGSDQIPRHRMRRNKRSFETLTSNDGAVGQMAGTPNGNTSSQFPYSQDNMWAMGAPVQRSQTAGGISSDVAPLPYQDEREVKRQRRKQSNRESARRSRLRKQAECEDLGLRVSSLSTENSSLRKELAELQERCSKLSSENARLRDQARDTSGKKSEDPQHGTTGVVRSPIISGKSEVFVDDGIDLQGEDVAGATVTQLEALVDAAEQQNEVEIANEAIELPVEDLPKEEFHLKSEEELSTVTDVKGELQGNA